MNPPTRFNRIDPLSMNGEPYAEISRTAFCVYLHLEGENIETFSVGEARKLYEWLGRALPQAEIEVKSWSSWPVCVVGRW